MSDRIIIDHMHNNITIQVKTITLATLEHDMILDWIKTFIQNLESTNFQIEIPGDTKGNN